MEELEARHRKEQKELQGKITSKKKNATKKTRKGVNDQCDRLTQELKERQQAEIEDLAPTQTEDKSPDLDVNGRDDQEDDVNNAKDADSAKNTISTQNGRREEGHAAISQSQPKKQNRQKARLARRAEEQEAQIEAATVEAANMPDQRQQELSSMKEQMESHGLTETLIRPDGHCLYSACVQTMASDKAKDYRDVRRVAADFMVSHPDDFAPFMEEPVESYTHKIKNTAEWGGHLELLAIAKAFDVKINVLQASGHTEQITPETTPEKEIWLAYYKHSFGLGEHYNALKRKFTS